MVAAMPADGPVSQPADRWREILRDRQVPETIRAAAPEQNWSLEPERFRWRPDDPAQLSHRPSRHRALEALPKRGVVLDVGVGGGGSSLGLAKKVELIIGVDRLPTMLDSFEASARAAGVAARSVLGTWPAVADQVEVVDVAVSHHAVYGIARGIHHRLDGTRPSPGRPRALDRLPAGRLRPLWKAFHGIDRPDHRPAEEVEAVLVAMGLGVERVEAVVPPRVPDVVPESVAFARRRLYVGPECDAEIAEFLRTEPPEEHEVVALWWSGAAVEVGPTR